MMHFNYMLLTFGLLIFSFQDASSQAFSGTYAFICKLSRKKGPCKAAFVRFYYNKRTGNCEKFIYGGCKGNKNNFLTLTECIMKCQYYGKEATEIFAFAQLAADYSGSIFPVRCSNIHFVLDSGVRTVYFHAMNFWVSLKRLSYFFFSLSGLYPTKCTFIPTIGWCRSPSVRYFFNPTLAKCLMFTYSGCGGNANNFLTLSECRKECKRIATKKCEEFIYGGCEGNENNFQNWFQCRATCQPSEYH
ncbi:doenitin-1-like [Vipera latastei]